MSDDPRAIAEGLTFEQFLWRSSRGLRERADGARVRRTSKGTWLAYDPAGEIIRVSCNSDGTTYIPRPWHTGRDKPPIWEFQTASRAMNHLDAAILQERQP